MELKHEQITQYIPAIYLAVMNGDIKKLQVIVFFVVFRPSRQFDRLFVRVFLRLLNVPKC